MYIENGKLGWGRSDRGKSSGECLVWSDNSQKYYKNEIIWVISSYLIISQHYHIHGKYIYIYKYSIFTQTHTCVFLYKLYTYIQFLDKCPVFKQVC